MGATLVILVAMLFSLPVFALALSLSSIAAAIREDIAALERRRELVDEDPADYWKRGPAD